ncbi:IS110 family transposase [Salinispora arenicola]|uniref:IS110 family transposase n=1 Tax=Salinispora arenicola TaxID=168697 RepID=UPI000369AE49|nr:IS110 family transposase [Salinispora arenicola]
MLGVGIDWAEEFHLVALGRPGEGVVEVARVEPTPAAVEALVARIAGLEPDPAEVRVVIETRHGLLVEALVDAGYTVLPVNPDLVARRRGPARKKDDAEDARIACLLALDQYTELRALVPHGQLAGELRAIARDDVRAARDERRLLNRLRADLAATFPAALTIAGDDLGSPVVLKLLQRWPTAGELAAAGHDEVEALARQAKHGWPHRLADRCAQALAGDHFQARDYLVRAKADTIRLACAQLLLLREQRRAWERRMGELLLGDRRRGRAKQPGDDRGPAVPDGEIYLSFPGLGDRLAARVAGEIGDAIGQFDTPNALQCYAGKAPVTRRSGKSELVVASRLACNRYLAEAVQQWAFTSLRTSGWAREFYDTQRSRGKKHHAALRALGNRWLEVLWHCLTKGMPYDENVHVANRNRALGRVNQPTKLAA